MSIPTNIQGTAWTIADDGFVYVVTSSVTPNNNTKLVMSVYRDNELCRGIKVESYADLKAHYTQVEGFQP